MRERGGLLKIGNDDVVNFFPSACRIQIRQAISELVEKFNFLSLSTSSRTARSIWLDPTLEKISIGKTSADQTLEFPIYLLVPSVEHCLSCAYFTAGTSTMLQTGGALLGSQASPALCCLSLARWESVWVHTLPPHVGTKNNFAPLYACGRYVDNKLSIGLIHTNEYPQSWNSLFSLDFYPTIAMENEGSVEALGAILIPVQVRGYWQVFSLAKVPLFLDIVKKIERGDSDWISKPLKWYESKNLAESKIRGKLNYFRKITSPTDVLILFATVQVMIVCLALGFQVKSIRKAFSQILKSGNTNFASDKKISYLIDKESSPLLLAKHLSKLTGEVFKSFNK